MWPKDAQIWEKFLKVNHSISLPFGDIVHFLLKNRSLGCFTLGCKNRENLIFHIWCKENIPKVQEGQKLT